MYQESLLGDCAPQAGNKFLGSPAEHCGYVGFPCTPLATSLASVHAKTSRQKEGLWIYRLLPVMTFQRLSMYLSITMQANATLSEFFVVNVSSSLYGSTYRLPRFLFTMLELALKLILSSSS